ncbi:ENTH domain [Arabidopsis thaliana x Arabidopsis arenosa]|uniref:ENTH domain n=1 Tax=Arabidopsis thaliana x Arabidopsis arenosa TaxID=1240361 RepID=A0A8T1ZKG9_9BRAS|nr:ENTH domain [Arabidopsis thaliana x Arabidopsis arenosa]
MSMMSKNRSSIAMGTPSFLELKKQASFFFKEKLKTARLALTDVTPLQLMTEEATDGESCGPNTQTLGTISKAAFEFEDYLAIVEVLHKRLARFDKRNWRMAYNSLIVVEHLLIHGPESVSDEFQGDRDVISQMQTFQQIDEKGFNWGLAVRKKAEKVLKLLEKGELLKEERKRARELSRGIQGFGSFNHKSSSHSLSEDEVLQESTVYRKCNSNFTKKHNEDDQENTMVSPNDADNFPQPLVTDPSEESRTSMKENMDPEDDENTEVNPLLGLSKKEGQELAGEDENHPFTDGESKHTVVSLLDENTD